MTRWSSAREPVLAGQGVRHQVQQAGTDLSFEQALDLLAHSAGFRDFLSRTLVECDYPALRWETPPVTQRTLGRGFEFVLINDPPLARRPEPTVFSGHFDGLAGDVLVVAVPNLGRTARLIVPRACGSAAACVHLKAFLQGAPAAQVHALWRCVSTTARQEISERRLWLSTAGGGVAWLHVRLDRMPKYYVYGPYANAL